MIKAISTRVAQYVSVKTFADSPRGLVVEDRGADLGGRGQAAVGNGAVSVLAAHVRGIEDDRQVGCR